MRNIILLTYDSVRADHCSYLNYHRDTTPHLDALADSGVSYANAISPASRTNPSMSGIMTGEPMRYSDKVSDPRHARNHLARHGTIAEDLATAGYATGAFCPNAYASRYYGFDRGFNHYEDFLFTNERYQRLWERHISDSGWFTTFRNIRNFIRRDEAFRTWDTYLDEAVTWAEEQSEPFFLWIFSLDPHYPYLTPRRHRTFSSLVDQYYYNWKCYTLIDEFDTEFSERTKQKMIDIYDDSIRFADILITEIQNRLSEFNPVIIVHSDHGEAFGERGMYGHSFPYLHDENIRVPLVVSGTDKSEHVTKPASLLNLRDGMSVLQEGHTPDLTSDAALSTEYDGRNDRKLTAVRSERFKYLITKSDGTVRRELYDLKNDPAEQHDIGAYNSEIARDLRIIGNQSEAHDQEVLRIQQAVSRLDQV